MTVACPSLRGGVQFDFARPGDVYVSLPARLPACPPGLACLPARLPFSSLGCCPAGQNEDVWRERWVVLQQGVVLCFSNSEHVPDRHAERKPKLFVPLRDVKLSSCLSCSPRKPFCLRFCSNSSSDPESD